MRKEKGVSTSDVTLYTLTPEEVRDALVLYMYEVHSIPVDIRQQGSFSSVHSVSVNVDRDVTIDVKWREPSVTWEETVDDQHS